MQDRELALEILEQIDIAAGRVLNRFEPIRSVDDFVLSESGIEKLDAICMQLIAIGESLKNLDKVTNGELLPRFPEIEWKKAMGLRDIITHHYFDVNAEAIFDVCSTRIPALKTSIERIIRSLTGTVE
jgi:uncharacterized protein with HEPN domain